MKDIISEWNRKDDTPESTIDRIRSILSLLGIETIQTEENEYRGLWYSNRIEIKHLHGVGTNGKGITKEYALASAYGEFMERLQSGMLFDRLYSEYSTKLPAVEVESCFEKTWADMQTFFGDVCRKLDSKKFSELLEISYGMVSFDSLKNDTPRMFSKRMIEVLCGSNGLAAGNTFMEAFTQGLGEILERYVIQFIYKQHYESNTFAVIDDRALCGLNSYSLIEAIREKKYFPYVIDCSLGGKIPVVGVLVFNPSKSKYLFKLGADPCLDIALQRCITEIFQGVSFDINFRMKMRDYLNCPEGQFWFDSNRRNNHARTEVDGSGSLPLQFLRCLNSSTSQTRGFIRDYITNELAAQHLIDSAKSICDEIVVKNHSRFGFPCIRVMVPSMCDSFYYPGEDIYQVCKDIDKVRLLRQTGKMFTHEAADCLARILEYPSYTYEFNIQKLFGILIDWSEERDYMVSPYYMLGYIALYLNDYNRAKKFIIRANEYARVSDRLKNGDEVILEAINQTIPHGDLIEFLGPVDMDGQLIKRANRLYSIADNGVFIPTCQDCRECEMSDFCAVEHCNILRTNFANYQEITTLDDEYKQFLNRLQSFFTIRERGDLS